MARDRVSRARGSGWPDLSMAGPASGFRTGLRPYIPSTQSGTIPFLEFTMSDAIDPEAIESRQRRPRTEVAGAEIYQCVIGSSANPGLRDFAIAALIVDGKQAHDRVSFDVNPPSRQTLETLDAEGYLLKLIAAGARVHQAGCMGCIGMGKHRPRATSACGPSPATFPAARARQKTASTSAVRRRHNSAITGVITDPREQQDQPEPETT